MGIWGSYFSKYDGGILQEYSDIDKFTCLGFITEDHDYLDKEAPVIIKFQRPVKFKELELEKQLEKGPNNERICAFCGKYMR